MANLIEQLTAIEDSEAPYNLPWPALEPVEEFQR